MSQKITAAFDLKKKILKKVVSHFLWTNGLNNSLIFPDI